jgi:uncharacterized protein (TIGR02996 family)
VPPDEASLLRAILEAPDADEPRLAYAARLAESSRLSDQARAEFIRLQIQLSQSTPSEPDWPAWIARERDLLERYRTAWEKPLRDLLRPSLGSPGRWLRSHLFGTGGRWGFRRGFVEHILAPAPTFLAEDIAIFGHTPVRRVVLTHASECIEQLAADRRMDQLASLHLVGDMEMDEDLSLLAGAARSVGLVVLEFRLPRMWEEMDALSEALRSSDESDFRRLESFAAWRQANPDGRQRLTQLASSLAIGFVHRGAADEGEMLAINEWVYLGRNLSEAGAWAVAKSHQDLEDEEGRCRRLVLLRPGAGDELRHSPYFVGELG